MVDPLYIPQAMAEAGYTEMVLRRRKVYKAFDIVAITPSSGLTEIRIDHAKDMSESDVLKFRESIRLTFNRLVLEQFGISEVLGIAVNLAPALRPLYSGVDWVITRICHQNEGGYNNTNKGRSRSHDVRKNTYHKKRARRQWT